MQKLKELYDYCQTLPVPPRIKRKVIETKIRELTGLEARVFIVDLDHEVCRGIFISASAAGTALSRQANGKAVIALARGLNRCWDRFVQVKELMHLFDAADEQTPTDVEFLKLLTDFVVTLPEEETSKAMVSETRALLMALACLCPEKKRLLFVEEYNRGEIDYYNIAVQLRIPEQYVPYLFLPRFPDIIATFWN